IVLARQIKLVVLNPQEFNTTFTDFEDKIKQSQEYQELFAEAYPTINKEKTISRYSISDALANYIAELYSFNSEFDQYVKGEIAEIDPSVINGFNIFMGKGACGTCHFAPTFNGLVPPLYSESESEVLGVPATTDSINPQLDADVGRIDNGINPDLFPFYAHSFKTVTVRNVALTAPYMHNGVYNTLEEVMDFYNKGGGSGMGIDVAHQTLPDAPLGLTKKEISDVISFMEALTDTTNLTNRPVMLPKFKEHPEWNNRPIGGKDY
ncbi:MAG: cytochrome c peroxidase, partial [Bacteroidota bacterium]